MTKKNIVLIVIAALFVTGVFFITEYRNKNIEKSLYLAKDASIIATSSGISEEEINDNNRDSDGDGLRDWEEVLWGTNPYGVDTDSDGTSDGAEINAGRNPLVKKTKTVDDRFNSLAKKASATASSTEKLTLTDEFGRDVFSKYMELRQAGLVKDKTEQQQLINDILTSGKFNLSPKKYTDAELLQKNDSSQASLELYANQMHAIFKQNTIDSRNEGLIVKESLEKGDPTILKELVPIIASYKALIKGVIATPAPEPIYYLHKSLVNSLSTLIFVDESFSKVAVDPIVALQGLARVQDSSTALYDSVRGIADYMTAQGVNFNLQ